MAIPPVSIRPYGYSEVSPFDDYRDRNFAGFSNDVEDPKRERGKKWAEDTAWYANSSVYSHVLELLLKIPSYFIFNSDLKNEWWAKSMFVAERLTGTLGDMFRNFIYGHKDTNGNYDDNIGAELKAGESQHSIGIVNNHLQTKGKFLVAALGLISPTLANDLEWAIVRAFDGVWWRSMGMHLAYGPNFGRRVLQAVMGGQTLTPEDEQNKITPGFIIGKFKEHWSNAWQAFNSLRNTEERDGFQRNYLNFCEHSNKFVSAFLPVVNTLNLIGDIGRPIARRLGIEGLPRNIFRILSVIDRPFSWFTNMFAYYLPEKLVQRVHAEKQNHAAFNHLSYSDLLAGSVLGDVVDFGLLLLEDKIKDASGGLNHIAEIARRIKDSAQDIYFSYRRTRAANELPRLAVKS